MTALQILAKASIATINEIEARQIAQALLMDSSLRIATAVANKVEKDLQELGWLSLAV